MLRGKRLVLTPTGSPGEAAVIEIFTMTGQTDQAGALFGPASLADCLIFIEKVTHGGHPATDYDGLEIHGFASEGDEPGTDAERTVWRAAEVAARQSARELAEAPSDDDVPLGDFGIESAERVPELDEVDDDPTGADERELELARREGDA